MSAKSNSSEMRAGGFHRFKDTKTSTCITLLFSEKRSSSRHLSTWGYVAENLNRNSRQRAAGD